jgi:hypothetical protein
MDDDLTLSLFDGSHIPRLRFERALAGLDLEAALADAPAACRAPLLEMRAALGQRSIADGDLDALVRCRRKNWPAEIERTWQRLVGLRLAASSVPGTLDGEPAGAFLRRGGDHDAARQALERHLRTSPRDVGVWEVLAAYDPIRSAARCAFHGGPVLEQLVGTLLDAIEEDELQPAAPWLLVFAWFDHQLALPDLAAALEAEGLNEAPAPTAGDARAFAWHVVQAGAGTSTDTRRVLKQISPAAFRRYLARIEGKRL